MHLTITTLNDEIVNVDVSEDLELENLKAQCEFETGIPSHEIALIWNGRPLHDNKMTLKAYGIKENDVLLLQHIRGQTQQVSSPPSQSPGGTFPAIDFGSIQIPGLQGGASGGRGASGPVPGPSQGPAGPIPQLDDPKKIRELLLNSPHDRALLKERNPPLSEALESGSLEKFADVFLKQQRERRERERERVRLIQADPFDPEAQMKIAEDIRLKNVDQNMETAIEHVPESFGQVVMLYIDCTVNGHHVKAFVDSGAQMTIMSQACAERCNIMRLVDTRWAGIAKGVGTQRIIGRVHLGQIQIGDDFLQSSFSILEDQPMDMLLGLDMLKRHLCCIDLKDNKLVIGTTGKSTPFLHESQLPDHARSLGPGSPGMSPSRVENEDRLLAEVMNKSAQEAAGNSGSSATNSSSSSAVSSSKPVAGPPSQIGGAGASGAQRTFPEEVIKKLMAEGFSREAVIQELTLANGNQDQALAALLAKSLQFSS